MRGKVKNEEEGWRMTGFSSLEGSGVLNCVGRCRRKCGFGEHYLILGKLSLKILQNARWRRPGGVEIEGSELQQAGAWRFRSELLTGRGKPGSWREDQGPDGI